MGTGNGKGVTLKPGETKSLRVSGTVPAASIEHGVVYISCDFGPIDQQYLSGFPSLFVLAKVPGKSGTASGTFFHDKDDDWNVDDGEPIGGLEVTLIDVDGSRAATAKTEADGTIKFGPMPAGWYVPTFNGPWKLRDGGFIVVSTDQFWSHGWVARLGPGPARPTSRRTPSRTHPFPARRSRTRRWPRPARM
jgi:hypothetical protein